MSYFGMTADEYCAALKCSISAFDRKPDRNGREVINEALAQAEGFIRSMLPVRYERLLRVVENEWVIRSAYEGQLACVLGAPVDDTNTLVLFKFSQDEGIYALPKRGDVSELVVTTDYTLSTSDKRTITLTSALSAGDRIIASYTTTLGDNCCTLRQSMKAVVNYMLAAEIFPTQAERFRRQYDATVELLDRMAKGQAHLVEVERIETLDEPDPQSVTGGTAVKKRDPA